MSPRTPVGVATHRSRLATGSAAAARTPPPRQTRGWFVGEQPNMRARGLWLLLAFAAMAVALLGHLIDLQVRQHGPLAAMAAKEHQLTFSLPAHRGRILDRQGRLLASDRPTYTVYVDPGYIEPASRHDAAGRLAEVLHLDPTNIEHILDRPTRYAFLARGVAENVKQQLDHLPVPGVIASLEAQRVYDPSPLPASSFAANLLGYVDSDGRGQYGVEGYYNNVLSGSPGQSSVVRDNQGNAIVLSQAQRVDPRDGRDIRLGLDSQVQYWAEQAVAKGVDYAQAESGQILIMDTHTGAIRGWAQYPSYDANHYTQTEYRRFKDLAVQSLYEPGSTMKVVTFAGAVENRAITPEYSFNEGPTNIDGSLIHDWDNRSHGTVTMQQVLDQSLNNGAIKAMSLEGKDAFYANLLGFGIGAPTGVDLYGEVNQPVTPQSRLHPLDYAEMAFGQTAQATPIEMLAAINTVGNGGVWVQPHAAEAVVDPTTGRQTPFVPKTRQVVSAATARQVAQMMTGVVDNKDGSGFAARIAAFKGKVAGKTGTASEPTNGRYSGDTIASFVGFLPADNPQFTMLVLMNHPHTTKVDHEGAFLAAPPFKEMAQVVIDLWRIVPN